MDKPIRVLQENVIMDPGGIESLLMNLYRHIDRSKVQFDFLLHRNRKGFYDDEIKSLGGKIFYVERFNPFHHFKYLKSMDSFFKSHPEYKIIHAHAELNYWPLKVAKKNGVPIRIAHSHNAKSSINLKYFFMRYQKIRIHSAANYCFMCSENAGRWSYGNKYVDNDKCIYVKNGIEVDKFRFNPMIRKEMRKELGVENKTVFIHIGRFMQQKNHDFLIDIFNEIHKLNENAILLLVSEGRLMEKIKNKVNRLSLNDCVKFLGFRSDADKLYQAADAFLLPSLWEGLPFTAIEAEASGLPCFLSDVITDECVITPSTFKISLKANAKEWATFILNRITLLKREDSSDYIRNAGYDIENTANALQEFYLKHYKYGQ